MDPVRRALILLLFASVMLTEPTSARAAIAPERAGLSPVATAQWIRRLAVAIRQTVKPAATSPAWHAFRVPLLPPAAIAAQVIAAHPALLDHAFRLPPPTV